MNNISETRKATIIIQDAIKRTSHTLEINVYNNGEDKTTMIMTGELRFKLAELLNTHQRYISILFYNHIPSDDQYLELRDIYSEILKFVHIKRGDWDARRDVILYRTRKRRDAGLGN
jgi:hypothetical protein